MKLAVLIGVALACVLTVWGQGPTGTITGNVVDTSGGFIAGASVTATNTGTGAETRTTTNSTGGYRFVELQPGMYSATVEALFHGPGVLNSDVSIWKNIRITERQSLVFRGDAFNFFNHTQFYNPGDATGVNRIDSPSFGQVQFARDPRLIQLQLQYKF